MAKLTMLLVLIFCCAHAEDATLYTFSGANGLSGTFTLDDTVPFDITMGFGGSLFARLASPENTLSGTFGAYTFTGTGVELHTFHNYFVPPPFDFPSSYWIVRSQITGPQVNGLTPTILNLFLYDSVNPNQFPSLNPPIPGSPNEFNFQYAFAWSDNSFVTDPLTTLVMIPEGSSLLLLVFGSLLALAYIRRRRTFPQHLALE